MNACSNNTPLDIFGLYREVIKCGGLVRNERYDESNRWCGNINFAGTIFPNMRNYTPNHKATSIGNQLLSNYKKFLYEYEKCYAPRDLHGVPFDEVSWTKTCPVEVLILGLPVSLDVTVMSVVSLSS